MNISGSGKIPAGEYADKISVSGSGRLDGNIRCQALSCSGAVRGTGSVDCKEDTRISGACRLDGDLKAENVSVSGSMHVGGDVSAVDTVKISGMLTCGGAVKCGTLKCSGSIEAGKDVEAEEIRISGRVCCNGLLNGERVEISLESNSRSRVGSIGGSQITVRDDKQGKKLCRLPLLSKLLGGSGQLTVEESVEGDTVAVEGMKAPCVVGRVVAIGAGCHIGLVRYSEDLEIHPEAQVDACEKV